MAEANCANPPDCDWLSIGYDQYIGSFTLDENHSININYGNNNDHIQPYDQWNTFNIVNKENINIQNHGDLSQMADDGLSTIHKLWLDNIKLTESLQANQKKCREQTDYYQQANEAIIDLQNKLDSAKQSNQVLEEENKSWERLTNHTIDENKKLNTQTKKLKDKLLQCSNELRAERQKNNHLEHINSSFGQSVESQKRLIEQLNDTVNRLNAKSAKTFKKMGREILRLKQELRMRSRIPKAEVMESAR